MKKLLILILTICFMFAIVGCGSKEKKKNDSELYQKAVAILDEFKYEQRIIDFRKAYDLLTTLPDDDDNFVEQLSAVNKICKKYKLKLKYGNGILIDSKYGKDIKQETIDNYIKRNSLKDAEKIMLSLVYPVLFEKYGYDAQCIKGLHSNHVNKSIRDTHSYKFAYSSDHDPYLQDCWTYVKEPRSHFLYQYYVNGLVKLVEFPIAISTNPLDKNNRDLFWKQEPQIQKQITSNRIEEMLPQINLITSKNKVLKYIFTDKELYILNNYITSLNVNDIWEKEYYHKLLEQRGQSPSKKYYGSATIKFKYNGNTIYIAYGLDDIMLCITGNNKVNKLSNKWCTLLGGLIYFNQEYMLKKYHEEITNNITSNENMQVGEHNLNLITDKYLNNNTTSSQISSNNTTQAKPGVIIDTKYYTVKIPSSWSNDCTYKIHEADNHAYHLTFYEKLSHQKNGDGKLFTIMLYPGFEDYTMLPEYNYLGKLKIKGLGNFNVIITYPTDITFAEEYVEKYNDLKEAIPYVLKNITFKEGYTFSNQPNK